MIFYVNFGKRPISMRFETQEVQRNDIGKFPVTMMFDSREWEESFTVSMDAEEAISLGESLVNAGYAVKTNKKYEMKARI